MLLNLLMLSALLPFVIMPVDGNNISINGTQVTMFNRVYPSPASPMWWPRSRAGRLFAASSGSYTAQCYSTTSGLYTVTSDRWMVLFGGESDSSKGTNDVWLGSSDAQNWCFAAGTTADGITHPIFGGTSFPPRDNAGYAGQFQYATSGFNAVVAAGIMGGSAVNDVWTSDISQNVYAKWTQRTNAAPWAKRYLPNMAIDRDSKIILYSGFAVPNSDAPTPIFNDCWVSADKGATWEKIGNFGHSRINAAFAAYPIMTQNLLIGGLDQFGDLYNDVWSVKPPTIAQYANAPFSPRQGHGAVAPYSALWVLGGKTNTQQLNDVWHALGFEPENWKQCSNAEWSARWNHMVFLDSPENIWVMGGISDNSALNDIWVSTFRAYQPPSGC